MIEGVVLAPLHFTDPDLSSFSQLLFGVRSNDPVTLAVMSLVLISAALLACYRPARRAARVDPMVALRYD